MSSSRLRQNPAFALLLGTVGAAIAWAIVQGATRPKDEGEKEKEKT